MPPPRIIEIASPWTPYGLTGDPFFQDPLGTDGVERSRAVASLFVGRETEIQLLGRQIVGATSSRAIVEGAPGVGKTSFVNRLKAALGSPQSSARVTISHVQPIRVHAEMTVHDFCVEVLRTLLQMHTTQSEHAPTRESRTEMAFWRRIGRIINGEDTLGVGLTIGALGGSAEPSRIPAERTGTSLYEEMETAFRYLSADGTRGVLMHVNNLENLSRADTKHAAELFQDLRDYFLIPQSHWVFVGMVGIEASIFRRTPQVSGIIPLAVRLDPLTAAQVAELLTLRYKALARGRQWIAPVADDALTNLYSRYHGDLRNFLRLLSQAVQRTAVSDPPAPLAESRILASMTATYQSELLEKITRDDARALARLVMRKPIGFTFRVADLQAAASLSQSAASRLVLRLETANVIAVDRTEGRSTYYRLHGDATIAFAMV